ncbi:hypothetical protein B4916_21685 [Yersinia intermedia]|nr:hypothetical protein B4916_21685 [Yersinia intermedia]
MCALGDYPSVKRRDAQEKCEEARIPVKHGGHSCRSSIVGQTQTDESRNTFEIMAAGWLQMQNWQISPKHASG